MPKKKTKILIVKGCEKNKVKESHRTLDTDPKAINEEVRTVMSIFREIEDIHSHERLLTQLMLEFYNKLAIDDFCQDFFECMRHIMIYQDRNKTEIPFLFCVRFVISCIKSDLNKKNCTNSTLLLKRMVTFITWYESTIDSNVRFHSVQVARILLTELTDDIPVSELLFEKIQTLLLKRFWDIKSYVRSEAARASSRLQDPSDHDCPIVVALTHLSRFDGSHTVRLAAMQALAITTTTLPCIVARVRDVNDLVRKKSFDLLAKWKILKPLTVSKRLQIIESGLTDKSEIVKTSCKDLLKVWLVASNNDPVVLLKRFDVENKEEATELAFTNLLSALTSTEVISLVEYLCQLMDENGLVRDDKLSPEVAFLWKNLVVFMSDHSEEYEKYLEKVLPSVPNFEPYLHRLFQKPIEQNILKEISLDEYAEYCTIIKHLLPIVKYLDVFDLYNRKKIIDLIKWAMSSSDIPFNYVEHLMKILVHLESNNVKICDEMVALINDLLFENDTTIDSGAMVVDQIDVKCAVIKNNDAPVPVTVNVDMTKDHTVINKEALRKKRIEIAELDVKINELKETITISMQAKEFDGVQIMVNELMILESKKTELLALKDQLTTAAEINVPEMIVTEPIVDLTIATSNVMKTETQDNPLWMNSGMESRIIKANIMTITMIQECNLLWTMPPSLRSLVDNVILISVRHIDQCVRQKAILSLGLCCLLDRELAIKYYPIFLKSLEVDHDPIKEIAVKSLIDLFIRFGIEPFQDSLIASKENSKITEQHSFTAATPIEESFGTNNTLCSIVLTDEEQNKCVAELLNPIIVLLNSDRIELQTAASVGLSKLLYHHKLMSSKLLSRLLLLWFNPETENNVMLRQHLGGFFSSYSLMSSTNQESITSCFIITMRTLFKASATSPLSEIDINNVTDFFLRVTDSQYLLENRTKKDKINDNDLLSKDVSQLNSLMTIEVLPDLENPCHNDLALIISNQILKAPLSSEVKYYVAMLVRLRLCSSNIDVIRNIESLVTIIIKKLKDKKSLQLLYRFHKEVLLKLGVSGADTEASSVQEISIDQNMTESSIPQTPICKPMLLEVNTVGKPQNRRFISTRTNDFVSDLSSNDTDDTLVDDHTMENVEEEEAGGDDRQEVVVMTNDNVDLDVSDDDIFKKPRNVRVTRSSSRICSSVLSGDSYRSLADTASSSTKVTRRPNVRKK